jgi:hypothetical protein
MRFALFSLAALCAFLVPTTELRTFAKTLRSRADVAMVGNSVMSHASKCDARSEGIAALLAERRGRDVLDLSIPGQLPEEELNLAALALRNPGVRQIVVPMSLADLGDWDTLSLQALLFWRSVNPALPGPSLWGRVGPYLLTGPPIASREGFNWEGMKAEVGHPGYDAIKEHFTLEKQKMGCPENDGFDADFNRAYYENQYVQLPIRRENLDVMGAFASQARARGVRVIWPFLPINLELMQRLQPSAAAAARARVKQLIAALATRDIRVLDLSELVPNDEFADRWCACGHLLLAGRQRVANAEHAALASPP